ncbi:MAG: Lrp/AsnC family transcriptional regulator [Deltaproteobacteria bacterium]|nr:Lrp/AsnC family transcriptional regulator [Deltaproteobacteria bacterium]
MTDKSQKANIESPAIDDDGDYNLTELEKKLIYHLSRDLGRSERPYAELALKLGVDEQTVLALIKSFKDRGLIRRLGAVVFHQRSGYGANAMVVWPVAEANMDVAGERFAQLPYVSHCYFRPKVQGWPYTLYTMIHAKDDQKLVEMISQMAKCINNNDFRILKSLKELKKSSIQYFTHLFDE